MKWIIRTSLQLRFMAVIIAVLLLGYGTAQLRNMPIDVFPEFNPPLVEIQTEALGLSAAEMEALITVPLEADLLNGVAWLDQIYSETVVGLSSIILVFEPGTDPIRARQMVQERLVETFALPNVSSPPTMLQPLSTTNRVMMVGLSSNELSLLDMGVLARWVIKPRLQGVPGVGNVAIWGQREWQLQVLVDPDRLRETGVPLQRIIETTGEALWVSPLSYLESSSPGTAGWIDTANQRLSIRHNLPISSAEELGQVSVIGTAWKLSDLTEVVEDHQPLIGDTFLKDGPGLLLVIEKFPEANTLQITREVEEALKALQPGLTGIEIDTTVFRPANYIEHALGNISTTLLIGALLAVLVLFALAHHWRTALIAMVTIPLSLVTAGYVLYLRDVSMNALVFAGLMIILGVIVDDAVLDVEHITRRLRQHREEGSVKSRSTIIIEAALEMRSPLLYATLIILLAIFPVFFLQGLTGSFFQPLAVSYTMAVLASLAVALILTPSLSMLFLANAKLEHRQSPIMARLQDAFERFLSPRIQSPRSAYLTVAILLVVGLGVLPFFNWSPMPELKQTELLIEWEGPPGTSLQEMGRITELVIGELKAISGVQNVGAHAGRAITGDAVVSVNAGEIWISLDPAHDYDSMVSAIRDVMDGYPGFFHEVDNYQPERITETLVGPDKDIIVRLYGYEYDILHNKAEEVRNSLVGIGGLVDLEIERVIEKPQIEIQVDLNTAERFQIKPGDVRRSVTTLLSGLRVGNLYEENKVFDVVVWGVPEIREHLTDIHELLIDTPRGGHVRVGEVAEIRIRPAPITIERDAVSRYVDITAIVSGRPPGSVAADIEGRLQGITFPLEYHAEVIGAFSEGQQNTGPGIISLIIATMLGVFLLMQASFKSWPLALVGLAVPAALTGGLMAALFGGAVLTLGSLFGFLAILGIVVRSSLVMYSHFEHLEVHEGLPFGPELVLRGMRERLTPILITTLATGLLFLPVLIAGAISGLEIIHPMSVVILGGLVTTTLLNLLVLPALYLRFGARREADLGFQIPEPSASAAD